MNMMHMIEILPPRKSEISDPDDSNIGKHKPRVEAFLKGLLLIAMIVLGATPLSYAQNSASTNVTINATVIQGLTLAVSGGPLNFGTIVAGTTAAAISAQSSTVLFTVTGNGGGSVTVTYSGVTLNGPGGATLAFTPSVSGSASSGGQGSSTSVSSGSSITLSGSTGSAGNYYLWLGGSLGSIPSNQTPGSYTGTFTMSVNY